MIGIVVGTAAPGHSFRSFFAARAMEYYKFKITSVPYGKGGLTTETLSYGEEVV